MIADKFLNTVMATDANYILRFLTNKNVHTTTWCLASALAVYAFYRWREGPYYTKPYRLDGKVVIITGCNTGIGKEIALELAKRGARVYMACRNFEKCEQARIDIISKTLNRNVFNRTLDLSSLQNIREFVDSFLKEENRLDILINNAGLMNTPFTLTQDGFEQQFGVNHLGHFLLTHLLLPVLKTSAPSRIVVVSSMLHFMGSINKDDLNGVRHYSKFAAYTNSKLANILFTRKMAQHLKDSNVTINCLHPGYVRTDISRYDPINRFLNSTLGRLFLRSTVGGAQTAIYLALDPAVNNKSGDYYDRMKVARVSFKAKDDEMAEWLWQESLKMVGLNNVSK